MLPYSREIRFRCLATMPGVAIAGAAMGAAFGMNADAPGTQGPFWFASAMCVGSYVSAILEAATLRIFRFAPNTLNGDVVGFGWDLALGAVAGAFLSSIMPVALIESVGAASAILFLQRLVLEKMIIGNLVGDTLVALLQGGGRAIPDYSRASALAVRNDFDGARTEFEAAIAADPKDPRAYLAFARMERDQAHDPARAAAAFTRVLALKRTDARTRAAVTREIAELYMYRLKNPGRAAALLARHIDEYGSTENVEWARTVLRNAKEMTLSE